MNARARCLIAWLCFGLLFSSAAGAQQPSPGPGPTPYPVLPLTGANGGTGVANTGKTITLGGNLTTSGAFASTFTMTNTTAVTFPTTGTLATTTDLASYLPLAGGTMSGSVIFAAANTVSWATRSILSSAADGRVLFTDTATTHGFTLRFTTDGTAAIRNRADSGDGNLTTGNLTAAGASVVMSGLASDAATTNNTVCITTTTNVLTKGSGTLGICLGTSSARYKHDIRGDVAGLKELTALETYSFVYNKGYGDDGARRQGGFLAEQMATVFPDLVFNDIEGRPNSIDWGGLLPVMVNAIRELKSEINELKAR